MGNRCGCSQTQPAMCAPYIQAQIESGAGNVPVASTRLTMRDIVGGIKARWNLGRMNYLVAPGLYAVGAPDTKAPVLVSANYKLTFDSLRKELSGINVWLLILDTKGVNVWCAAGKGTFGANELVARMASSNLAKVVAHRTIVLPQLGAPGVAAHDVAQQTGFRVVYGPVYARDIPAFLNAGMRKDRRMTRVTFTLRERLAVVPVELVLAAKYLPLLFIAGALAAFAETPRFSAQLLFEGAFFVGAALAGILCVPVFLPLFQPVRPFSAKGFIAGIIYAAVVALIANVAPLKAIAWGLIAAPIAGYLALNFTGATTFTSESGVRKEIKYAVPALLTALIAGILLRIALIVHTHI